MAENLSSGEKLRYSSNDEGGMIPTTTQERAAAASMQDTAAGAAATTAETATADQGRELPPGWLDGVARKLVVAGMAALAVMALVYPESRRREISAATEAIHQCDLAAAREDLDDEVRLKAQAHCHALRIAYRNDYGTEP